MRRMALVGAVAAAAMMAGAGVFSGPAAAGSATLSGQQLPGSIRPIGPYDAGAPFSSGQAVEVAIPPNDVLPKFRRVNILECSTRVLHAPSATQALADCDGDTIQGDTVLVRPDGSIDYRRYTIFALPDATTLGESTKGSPACSLHNRCVLYIGTDQTDIPSSAHFFSQPWTVAATPGDSGRHPGSGVATPPGGGFPTAAVAGSLGAVALAGIVLAFRYRTRRGGERTVRPGPSRNGSGRRPGAHTAPIRKGSDGGPVPVGKRKGTHQRRPATRVR